jgi:hypothetical protein
MDSIFSRTALPLLDSVLKWLVPVSVLTFFLSLFLIPWFIGRLSETCFLHVSSPETDRPKKYTLTALFIIIFRNVCGIVLFLAGTAMLFLPGQGVLTMLIGLLLLSFPGKQKIIHSLIHRKMTRQSLDWIRKKRGRKPFKWPDT